MWNLVQSNSFIAKQLRERDNRRNKSSLINIRSSIDNSAPRNHSHVFNKAKKKRQILGDFNTDRNNEIEHENMLLLKKMLVIDLKPSTLNPTKLIPKASSQSSLQKGARIRELTKISSENRRINNRLVSISSVYSSSKWAEDSRFNQYLRDVICHNPARPQRKEVQQYLKNREMIQSVLKNRERRPKTTGQEFFDKISQPLSEERPISSS